MLKINQVRSSSQKDEIFMLRLEVDSPSPVTDESLSPPPTSLDLESDSGDNGDNPGLPVATPVELGDVSEEGVEVIIEGFVVSKSSKKALEFFAVLLTIIVIVVTVVVTKKRNILGVQLENPVAHPSLPPSSSSSPTTTFDYDGFAKEIAVTVSGEEALKDPFSMQYKIWKLLAQQLPKLVEKSVVELNDTETLIQRYTVGVVGGSISEYLLAQPDLLYFQTEKMKVCDSPHFDCNENGEIISFFAMNERTTGVGRGIIATEIAFFPRLTQVVLVRSSLRGTIPSEIGNLKNLRILDLQGNLFSGTIPTQIGQLQNMELFDMNTNLIQKGIPTFMGNLIELRYLDMSQNLLTGSVPLNFASLKELQGLYLNKNSLTGSLDSFCDGESKNGTEDSIAIDGVPVGGSILSYNLEPGYMVDCQSTANLKTGIKCSCCSCE